MTGLISSNLFTHNVISGGFYFGTCKPNTLEKLQCKFCTKLNEIFREVKLRRLGTEDYSNNNKVPSLAVLQLISKFDGLIVLGLRQILVKGGSRSTYIQRAIEGYLQVKVKRGAGKK